MVEPISISDTETVSSEPESAGTPGLEHLWALKQLDRTGLSAWLLGLGGFITLTISAVMMLILVRYPDPSMYKNSVAFTAIISFFLVFYFAMGRGWHSDMLAFKRFDTALQSQFDVVRPGKLVIWFEILLACVCVVVNLQMNDNVNLGHSFGLMVSISVFYWIQWMMIVLAVDVILRQLVCLMRIVRVIRVDLLATGFYSTLANVMVRHVGLYIFGLCIISLSYIVFTEGALSAQEMLLLMMPWYLPGLIIISAYLVPYNHFKRRIRSAKQQELNSVSAALGGNQSALAQTLLSNESALSKIDLLYYQDRISAIKEWPFTDRIRALVLFGILPPLTWVIAAFIEISIESSL